MQTSNAMSAVPQTGHRGLSNLRLAGTVLIIGALSACSTIGTAPADTRHTAVNFSMGAATQEREARMVIVTMRNPDHASLVGAGSVAASPDAQPAAYRKLLDRWQQTYGLVRVADWPLSSLAVRCLVFELNTRKNLQQVLNDLRQEPLVETAQAIKTFQTATGQYNDPLINLQHGLASMKVASVHDLATGSGVKVAVIDTGLDTQHEEIDGRVPVKRNLVDGNPADFDLDVHGTAVAGVIAATANNRSGIVGIAPDATIMAMKACWQTKPSDDAARCNSFTLAKAINASIAAQADVINLSLTGPVDPLLDRLLRQAIEQRTIVVGAVNQEKPNTFPVATQGVLPVALPGWDANGAGVSSDVIHAPGQAVISLRPRNAYDTFSGTSIAAAHISGLAALAKERQPALTGRELLRALNASVTTTSGVASACRTLTNLLGVTARRCQQ